MTDVEYRRSAYRVAIATVERTRNGYAEVIRCLGETGRMTPTGPVMPNTAELSNIYARMLVAAEDDIRTLYREYRELV